MCEVCAAGDDPATTVCELCSNTGGAYKPVDRPGKWIHSLCATWVPEVFVSENNGNSIYTLSHLDKKRFKLKCVICNTSKGASVQCCYGKCVTPAHPWCAIRMPEKGMISLSYTLSKHSLQALSQKAHLPLTHPRIPFLTCPVTYPIRPPFTHLLMHPFITLSHTLIHNVSYFYHTNFLSPLSPC